MEKLRKKKLVVKLVILPLLILSIFVSSNHHHEDGHFHDDCPICLFQINSNSGNIPFTDIVVRLLEDKPLLPVKKEIFILCPKFSKPNQRAPPFIS